MSIASLDNIKEEPHSLEAEQMVLGGIFLDEKKIKDIVDTVKVDTFYQEQHKEIYSAIVYLYNKNEHINYNTIYERLKYLSNKHKKPEPDLDYILQLSTSVPSMSNYDNYVTVLIDLYGKREIYKLSKTMLTDDISGIASSELVEKVKNTIENIGTVSNVESVDLNSYVDVWLDNLEKREKVKIFETGFTKFDDMVKFKPGKLSIISARPGGAKSAFAGKIVSNFCKQNFKPLFVSLEMLKDEFLNRLVCMEAEVDYDKFETGDEFTDAEWKRILIAKEKISKYKYKFNDDGSMTIEKLRGFVKLLKKKGEIDILIIDYLQLLNTSNRSLNEYAQVSLISRILKQIAMEMEIPVIALSQLSRASIDKNGEIREPQLSDLRSSGSLEQDSDIVVMLHSKDVDNKFEDHKFITAFVRKNRQGISGRTDFTFFGDHMKFVEKRRNFDTGTWEIVPPKVFGEVDKPKVVKDETVKDVSPKIIEDNLPKENPNVTDIF